MIANAFDTVLIANRGEIALRIARTARRIGLRVVAVYSDADRDAAHVRAADEAYRIGPPAARDSYLNVDAILEAARRSGAQAIHPGYGFLSENAAFAARVEEAGLVFVGPPASAIEAMGNKARAKDLMEKAGVPSVPGFRGASADDAAYVAAAKSIGYPIMVKAAAGGGGRGMRLVTASDALPEALRSARSEASAAFGSDEILLERALVRPRHIEVQVLADRFGAIAHLGERDCSVQRRHQKVLEETPSPAVGPELRARMAETAIAAARAIAYVGAGTIEFLLDKDGRFYFMEMNTRLQVEHAVTEMTTGIDLVEWQFRVAAGEPLGFRQPDISFTGCAIEARLCAESPEEGFLPRSGPILAWAPPAADMDVRVDHCLTSSGEVSPYYDSMIAKFVAHGPTRDEAIRKLARALESAVLLGTPTNQAFLIDCLRDPAFRAGAAHTGFIVERFPAPSAAPLPPETLAAILAAAYLGDGRPGLLTQPSAHVVLTRGRDAVEADLTRRDGAVDVSLSIAGQSHAIRVARIETSAAEAPLLRARCEIGGRTFAIAFVNGESELIATADGRTWRLEKPDPLARKTRAANGDVLAPLSGRVVAVAADVGATVRAGDVLIILEAMKMEHRLSAELSGVVEELSVRVGDQTRVGQTLARIRPADGDPADV
jgi:geranyl-CoA carboxylase alpha subunit